MRRTKVPFNANLLIAAVLIVIPTGFMVFQFWLAGGRSGVNDHYEIKAVVPTAGGLASNARVTMAGAEVGKTAGVEIRGSRAIVTLRIKDKSVVPIPQDSTISLRARTALNENYVEITPGRSRRTLASGDVVPMSQADEFVDVDQILSLLQGRTRERAQQFIQGTGAGLDGKGSGLNQVLGSTADIFQDGGELTTGIVGTRRQTARLVDQFGKLTQTIGERGAAIRLLADRGGAAMKAVASRDRQLGQTIEELPQTLRTLQRASATIGATSGRSAPVLRNLAAAITALRPGITRLDSASSSALSVLREARAASKPLQGALGKVRSLAAPSAGALPQIKKALCETNPALRYITPYNKEIVGTLVGLGSASNSYDASGHLIRVAPLIGENSLPGLPDTVSSAFLTLRKSGIVGKQFGLGWDPYPPAGGLTDTRRGLGVAGPSEWPGTYPHIKADC
jgi:phospholipid/cholesterol/gamma-HCH transport system substrate-binding protein